MMIAPTIGRQVWYQPAAGAQVFSLSTAPFAATVVHVNSDATVNLVALDHLGNLHRIASCVLLEDDSKPATPYCTWPTAQKPTVTAPVLPEAKAKKVGA